MLIIDYGQFTCSYEVDGLTLSLHYNARLKSTTINVTCIP